MKKQNGITLVAMIITIIVMVILAGVVIVTAVMDGGILDRAQTALRENERAEVEDIIMASYVYKTTASMDIIGQLDLEETAKALYSNLTGSGYKMKTLAGTEAQNYEDIYTEGATSISLNVEGKRGTYTGTVEKNGLRDGMKIVEDTGNEVPPVGDGDETGTIPTPSEEIDLSAVVYMYNGMYNPEQPDIQWYRYGDDNEDNIADKNPYLYYYTETDMIIPVTYFSQVIGENKSDIEAVITHFDGTQETIVLKNEKEYRWEYSFTSPSIFGEMDTFIFCPYSESRYGQVGWIKNDNFHYLELGLGNAVPFKSISLLGGKIDFSFNCQAYVAMGDENLENIIPMYNDISKVSQVVINYSDGTNKSYSKEKIFDGNLYYMDDFYFSSKEIPVLYIDGAFYINMPDSHVEKQITSVILVEDGIAKKYNVSNNTQVMAMGAPN